MTVKSVVAGVVVSASVIALVVFAPIASTRAAAQIKEHPAGTGVEDGDYGVNWKKVPLAGLRRADLFEKVAAYKPDPVKFPVPRTKWDGKPDFNGVYYPGVRITKSKVPLESLYRPEVMPLRAKTDLIEWSNGFENPTFHCWPRDVLDGSMPTNLAIQILQAPGMVVLIDEEDARFRIIPIVDGPAKHNPARKPSYLGDSVGHWEGDTLVVDVTNFNGRPWLDGAVDKTGKRLLYEAQPGDVPPQTSSDALHLVEHWTLADGQTLEHQAVIVDDQKMLTAKWEGPKSRRPKQNYDRILEAICQEDPNLVQLEKAAQAFKKKQGGRK